MMVTARVCCDLNSASQSAGELISAGLWIEVPGVAFPEKDWSDGVVAVLSWSARTIERLLGGTEVAEVRFMEGPFLFRVGVEAAGEFRLELIESGRQPRTIWEGAILAAPFIESLLDACDQTTELCRNRGWQTRETSQLIDNAKLLRQRLGA